jgi:hypothetical protein
MRNVLIKKKSEGLHKVSCDCGFVKFFDRGADADRIGEKHAQACSPSIITRMFDGVEETSPNSRAHPKRPNDGVNQSMNDARY